MSSNPGPRPALARTETGLARPALRRPDDAAPSKPAPVEAEEPAKPAKAHDTSAGKPHGKSKKAKHGHKLSDKAPAKEVETVEVTVTLTKLSRRALKDAAQERDMTPEDLASLVLSAWLDR